MFRKFLCLVLIIIFVVNCVFVYAAAGNTPCYSLSDKTVQIGEIFSIDVTISNNPGIISLRFKVIWDQTVLELQSVSDSNILNGFTTPSPVVASPYTLRWADSLATTNNTTQGTVITLTFKALKNTDSTSIFVEHEESRNAAGEKIVFNNSVAVCKVIEAESMYNASGTVESFGNETGKVTVGLYKSGATTASYSTAVTGNSTSYSINNVAPGTYTMKVSKTNHVTREYTIIVNASNVTQDVKIHLKGDINGDGKSGRSHSIR